MTITIDQLFLDLDGVFANFDKKLRELFDGKHPLNELGLSKKVMWKKIASYKDHGGFYAALEWIDDAKKLWNIVHKYDPIILTGLPMGGWAEKQKRQWVLREMGYYEVICCFAKDKQMFAADTHLLIDDRKQNIDQWREKGGHAIHFISVEQTIADLSLYNFSIKQFYDAENML